MPQISTIDKVFRHSNIPLSLSDARNDDNPLTKVNDDFCAMTGYGREECIGRNCRFLQGDDRDQPARFELREALKHRRDIEVVLRNYTRSGTMFENLVFVSHVRDASGAVTHILGSQFAIRDLGSTETLNRHLWELGSGLSEIARESRALQFRTKRRLSVSVSTMLRSVVLQERLSDWVDR